MTTLATFLEQRWQEAEVAARESQKFERRDWHVIANEAARHCPATGWHVLAHNPAHVLADIASKRAIVAAHGRNALSEELGPELDDQCLVCTDSHDPEPWPCPTLRHLASVYSDHADYDKSWKP